MSVRTRAVNLLILLGSLGFTLLVLEGGLRIRASLSAKWSNQHIACCEQDPLLGWRHVPNRIARVVAREYEVFESFNSRGVRGPEYPIEKSDDEYRIIILGDSFAEGYSVEFKALFSEVMKRRLNAQNSHRVEVINLGVGGYSTDQELLQFQTEGKLYRPDLTVLMFYDNDVWFNGRSVYMPWGRGYKPLFGLENGELRLTYVPIPPPDEPADRLSSDSGSPAELSLLNRIKRAIAERSHLYRWVRSRIKNTASFYSVAIKLGIADSPGPDDTYPVPEEYGVYRRLSTPQIEAAWELTEALLAKLDHEVRSAGSELLLFYVPMSAAVYPSQWDRMKRNYHLTDEEWSVERVERRLYDLSQRLGIAFLDPLEQMRGESKALARSGERLYFEIDRHWNANGHRWVGEMLADSVEARLQARDLRSKAVTGRPAADR
jgi:lysophospholipase L1-like esterase